MKPNTRTKVGIGHRRSKRLWLTVPVLVYGRSRDKSNFHEKTHMLSVNAHGGLVTLTSKVELGQSLLLVNEATEEEQSCRVVYVGPEADGKTKVGLAFLHGAANFWQVYFPPIDRKSSPS